MTNRTTFGAVIGGIAIAAIALSGCFDKQVEPFKDAPTSKVRDSNPADIIEMPDGFSNVATKCDGHGHRLYVALPWQRQPGGHHGYR